MFSFSHYCVGRASASERREFEFDYSVHKGARGYVLGARNICMSVHSVMVGARNVCMGVSSFIMGVFNLIMVVLTTVVRIIGTDVLSFHAGRI